MAMRMAFRARRGGRDSTAEGDRVADQLGLRDVAPCPGIGLNLSGCPYQIDHGSHSPLIGALSHPIAEV